MNATSRAPTASEVVRVRHSTPTAPQAGRDGGTSPVAGDQAPTLQPRAWTGWRVRPGPWLLAVVLVMLALPPRLLATDRFVTTDELFWVGRAAAFGRAIETGQLSQ